MKRCSGSKVVAMRTSALQERRDRQILADIVRTYIETGEPVSSRAISKRFEESLSTATIRNIMVDSKKPDICISRTLRRVACQRLPPIVFSRRRLPPRRH